MQQSTVLLAPCHRFSVDRLWRAYGIRRLILLAGIYVTFFRIPLGAAGGLPFTRFYSFDEVGSASTGASLITDPLGRVGVVSNGHCIVLNDGTWMELIDRKDPDDLPLQIAFEADGQAFYGALGSWGKLMKNEYGKFRPVSARPPSAPGWVNATNFDRVVKLGGRVAIAGWNGVVIWNLSSGEQTFVEIPQLNSIFEYKGQLYLSSWDFGLRRISPTWNATEPIAVDGSRSLLIDQAAPLPDGRIVFAARDRRLLVFDGSTLAEWPTKLGVLPGARITAMRPLRDGSIAIAINDAGLFLVSSKGELLWSLTTPSYRYIKQVAAETDGPLWVANDQGVEKILYRSAVTIVDQRLGLPVYWPQLVSWRGKILAASNGRLFATSGTDAGDMLHFSLVPNQPETGVWAIAVHGDDLLLGNGYGVYLAEEDRFRRILHDLPVGRFVMTASGTCYVIGVNVISALRKIDGAWAEVSPREAGVGYPAVVHACAEAAWLELGANRVARVSLQNGRLGVRLFEDFPWPASRWINLGVWENIVTLSGYPFGQIYFDESAEKILSPAEVPKFIRDLPAPVGRMRTDPDGTLWISHGEGVSRWRKTENGHVWDNTGLEGIRVPVPTLQFTPGGHVWISNGAVLYHVDSQTLQSASGKVRPRLVSLFDARTGKELYSALSPNPGIPNRPWTLPYLSNSIGLRFLSHDLERLQPAPYEFRLNHSGNWSVFEGNSLLTLPDLREGDYTLEVRIAGSTTQENSVCALQFIVLPPWYRSNGALVIYILAATGLFSSLIIFWHRHKMKRQLELESLVQTRTEELRVTMAKLSNETRTAAIHQERNRLAGEIHDTVQQGLSGLLLQLDSTLKLAAVGGEVRQRLDVARRMVAFTRGELKHAVWDLESPFLENAELPDALCRISSLNTAPGLRIEVQVNGAPRALPQRFKHHLLRIAQEAITNAVRHGRAGKVDVALSFTDAIVLLSIRDDGCGFDSEHAIDRGLGHFGLRGIQSRAEQLNGHLRIESHPGIGTAVEVSIPLTFPLV